MRARPYDEGRVLRYLIWTFGIAFVIQAGVAALAASGEMFGMQVAMVAMMFVPAMGALLCDISAREVGLRPRLRTNLRYFALAWFGPLALTVLGAALYFLVFPAHFDLTGEYLAATAGPEAMDSLDGTVVKPPTVALFGAVASVTYAPIVNAIPAMGEEVGWRGFLYPQLKLRYGRVAGVLLGGLFWGMWHWPLIGAIGWEYGVDYVGFPIVGMALFCVFSVACGIICDWLFERTGTIWAPSVFHGAINAAATLPPLLCVVGTGSARLCGPAPMGIISGLPFVACAVALLVLGGRGQEEARVK